MARTPITRVRLTDTAANALYFHGPSVGYINTDFAITYTPADSFTWEIIFKCPSQATNGTVLGVIHEAGANDPGVTLTVQTNGILNGFIRCLDNGAPVANSTTRVDDNRWHHAALVRDTANDKLQLYLDGVKEADNTDSTTANIQLGSNAFLGCRNLRGNPDQYFKGSVAAVRISSVVRYSAAFPDVHNNDTWTADEHTDLLLVTRNAPGAPADLTGDASPTLEGITGSTGGYFV